MFTSFDEEEQSYYETPLMFVVEISTGRLLQITDLGEYPVAFAQTEDGFVSLTHTWHLVTFANGDVEKITDSLNLRYWDKELNIIETKPVENRDALSVSYSNRMSVYKDGKFYITGTISADIHRFLTVDVNTAEVKMLDTTVDAFVNTIRLTTFKDGMVCNLNGYNVK